MVRDEFTKCETDVRLDGKVAIITGATSGLGLETAKNFVKKGAKVIIASRSADKLDAARKEIMQSTEDANVVARVVDYESLASIRNFVHKTVSSEARLDILVNNIGAVGLGDRLTQDNLHVMMQVNYFGAFLLTYLLFPLLKQSAPSRIMSSGALGGIIDVDHMNEVGKFTDFGYYCNAKLATVLFTVEMAKRIQGSGVEVYSMDPGIFRTNFFRNYEENFWTRFWTQFLKVFGRSVERVALMPIYIAVDRKFNNQSGKHFRDCKEFYSTWYASDSVLTKKLWEESKRLTGVLTIDGINI